MSKDELEEINQTRRKLHSLFEKKHKDLTDEEVQKVSQELDKLIVDYSKKNCL